MRLSGTKTNSIHQYRGLGDQLWDISGTRPSLDLRFADSKSLVDATTGQNLVTFTRASSGTYVGSDGVLKTATTNEPRFDHNPTTGESLGLLVEEQRTNSIRNNTMVGAVAGTPGTLPTNWYQSNNTGLAANVIGTGVENGITYIDLRVNGTTTGSGQTNIYLETSTGIAALTAQTWSYAAYFKLQSGSLANVTSIRYALVENTSTGVAVTAAAQILDISSTALGSYRPVFTRTLSGGATVAALQPYIQININTGLVIDFTLRIGLPQLEQGAFATSVIPTTGTAATRNADVASITGTNFSSWYRQDEGTVFAETQLPAGSAVNTSSRSVIDATDGSTNNRVNIRAISSGTNQDQLTIRSGAVTIAQFGSSGTAVSSSARKIAAVYRLDDYASWATGAVTAATDTSGALPVGVNQITVGSAVGGSEFMSGTIRRLTYWPARLANSTLQDITR